MFRVIYFIHLHRILKITIMKKIILSVAAIFAFGFANAQETTEGGFSKGDLVISGAVGFGSEKQGDYKLNSFEIAPSIGYFVTSNIAVGGRLGFESQKEEAGIETKTNTFSIGAFGRYYMTPASKFSFFGELAANYSSSKVEEEGIAPLPDTESKENGFGIQVAPGISYFLNSNLAIEATFGILGYNTVDPDADGADSRNEFNFGLDLRDINLGIVYKF